MMLDRSRARRIVVLAADKAGPGRSRSWLREDREGKWERRALDLLDESSERAAELGLSVADVDRQVALALALMALTAEQSVGKRRR